MSVINRNVPKTQHVNVNILVCDLCALEHEIANNAAASGWTYTNTYVAGNQHATARHLCAGCTFDVFKATTAAKAKAKAYKSDAPKGGAK